jgi:rubredoxin
MAKWRCAICAYVYDSQKGDPESGIQPGIPFNELPDRWGCPDCGAEKTYFEPYENYESLMDTEG